MLSQNQFKSNLFESLKRNGIADKLKSQLRAKLVAELSLKTKGLEAQQEVTLLNRLIDSLIVGYLKSNNLQFSLSVFLPESGLSRANSILSTNDCLDILHLKNSRLKNVSCINIDSGFLTNI